MKITDSISKGLALLGFAAIGATSAQAQAISILEQPIPVSKCLTDTTAYLDIIAQFQAADQQFIRYQWFRQYPDAQQNSFDQIQIVDGEIIVVPFGAPVAAVTSRILFPGLAERFAGTYFGRAFIDRNGNDMLDPFEEFDQTMSVTVNTLSDPIIINETFKVYADNMMMGDPVSEGANSSAVTAEAGNVVMFNIDAHIFGQYDTENGNVPDFDIDIQWYMSDNGTNPDTTMLVNDGVYAGVNADMMSINVAAQMIGYSYWATLEGQCGEVTTRAFTLSDVPKIVIGTQPASAEACPGAETMIAADASISAQGETLSYQWMMGGMPISDGAEFTGTTTNTLTILENYLTKDVSDLSLMITASPSGLTAMTDPFVVTVTPDPVYTTDLDGTAQNLSVGDPLNLIVEVTGATSYQWYKDGNMIAGETKDTLSIATLATDDTGEYLVHAINDCGVEVPSASVTVTVTNSGIAASVRGVVPGSIVISPNPTSEIATARLSLESFAENATFSLHNTAGQIITSKSFDNNGQELVATFDINSLNLSDGMYFVVINVDGVTTTERLVVTSK